MSRRYFMSAKSRYIEPGAVKVSDKHSDAIAYLYVSKHNGRPGAQVFYGQQSKPVLWSNYRTIEERNANVRRYFEGRQARTKMMAELAAERKAENASPAAQQFEVGKTYTCRSVGDHDCIFSFEILARSAKQLTIREHGDTYKRGIYVYNGVEHCKPHGTYSMCAIIRADRKWED